MRKPGQANVEEHPKGTGKYRVRARVEGKLITVASGLSRPEADETADAYAIVRNERALRAGLTLSQFAIGFFQRRARKGVRAWKKDRSRWHARIDAAPIGQLAISTLSRRDIVEWLDGQTGAHQTVKNALNLLRVALAEAVDRELLSANPARDVKVHRSASAKAVDDLEGILSPDEQKRLLAAVPQEHRPLVVFALLVGLRQAEQWWLKHEDIGVGYVTICRSVNGEPPKGGRPRVAYLLEPAAHALALAPTGKEWVWPAMRGGRRQDGKAPKGWHDWVEAAGIGRRIRWHDLRHTCATSLLAGWWGRKWSLDEVCQHMGHSSVTVTERYARKLRDTHKLAIAATVFPASSPLMLPAATIPAEIQGANFETRTRDLRFTKAPLFGGIRDDLGGFAPGQSPPGNLENASLSLAGWELFRAAEYMGVACG